MGPKEKKERALGERLHVKGDRCQGPKCAAARRPQRPGVHGAKRQRRNVSEFARQLKEKQKFKVLYRLEEKALVMAYKEASKSTGNTAAKLMEILERRLDNAVYRLGVAASRSQARTMIVQGHIRVNGRRVTSPGYQVRAKDVVSIRPESAGKGLFKEVKEAMKRVEIPSWIKADTDKMEGTIVSLPADVPPPFEINLLVESFSK